MPVAWPAKVAKHYSDQLDDERLDGNLVNSKMVIMSCGHIKLLFLLVLIFCPRSFADIKKVQLHTFHLKLSISYILLFINLNLLA